MTEKCLKSLAICCLIMMLVWCHTMAQPHNWKPAPVPLTTPWTASVRPEMPFPEYPRPQMMRQDWRILNGLWDFTLSEQNTGFVRKGKILVPFPVESSLSGLAWQVEATHLMTYETRVTIPQNWRNSRILLHFGAVDWRTEVFVNGQKAGEHEGGYTPFYFDITDLLTSKDEQEISVRVTDPTDQGGQPCGKQRLRPEGIWYTPSSGIWQTVWMEPVPETYIRSFRVEPDVSKNRLFVRAEPTGNMSGKKIVARVKQDGLQLSQASGKSGTPLMLQIREPRLWSPDDPYLYDLEITIESDDGKVIDRVYSYVGMRKISVGKDDKGRHHILLNNRPIFLDGILDQGFWPDGLYTPPSGEAMLYDLEMVRKMGFNTIRKHVKVEPARWYYHCDRLGLMVLQDMPNAGNHTAEDRQQFRWELKSMVDALFNHPSVVMWIPFNEAWGQHDTEFYTEKLREWDPTRLVNNASGWTDAGVGDVVDIHEYPGPGVLPDATNRAAILGEYGGISLQIPGHLWSKTAWGYQTAKDPEELLNQYEDLRLALMQRSDSTGWSAAIYTQLTDVETESNGLMTYDRKVLKIDPELLQLSHKGYLPPKPDRSFSIIHGKTLLQLQCYKPDASIFFAIESKKTSWKPYKKPIPISKSTTLLCKAQWPDGTFSRIRRYRFQKVRAIPPGKPPKPLPDGWSVKIYEGNWDHLPDFTTLMPAKHINLQDVNLKETGMNKHFAAVFEGWIEIPATGVYNFQLRSDDGSRLYVGTHLVVENDGLHNMRSTTGAIALKKGFHLCRIEYFQKEGHNGLEWKFWPE